MQLINLYAEELRPASRRPTLAQVTGAWLVLLAVGAGVTLLLDHRQSERDRQLERLQAARETVAAEIRRAETTLAGRRPDPALQAENERIQAKLARGSRLLNRDADGALLASISMAGVLRGLAAQRVEGLWLEKFTAEPGPGLRLHGQAGEAARIPEYLQRLGHEQIFRGMQFGDLVLDDTGDPAAIAFRAGSDRGGLPDNTGDQQPWRL